MSIQRFVAAFGAASLWSALASAQVSQYTAPGGPDRSEMENRRDALEGAVAGARWSAGPLRIDPALWISDIAWADSPQRGIESDLTVRAGAGLRAYLPVGGKTTFAAFALPEYVWWEEREDERRLNQRFGIGAFTYFNRLAIEVTARRDENFDYATNEFFEKVTLRSDVLELDLEVPIYRSLSLRATGSLSAYESLAEDPGLELVYDNLDRDDTSYRGGVRFYPGESLFFGAGAGQFDSDFADEAVDRSNSGDFWYAEAGYDRPKISVSVDYQENELEGEAGSQFGRFEGSTGRGWVEWRPRETLRAQLYGSRALAYSLEFGEGSAFVNELVGVGLGVKLGWRLELDAFLESGTHEYEAALGGGGRVDDVESWGARLSVEIGRGIQVRLGYRESVISPDSGGPERELSELAGALSLGLGGPASGWY